MLLDAKTVASMKKPPPGKTDAIIFDEDLPGFGLRLRTGGRRTWVAQYRIDGRSRRITLGNAAVMSANEARKAARTVLARATIGEDPQGERLRKREQERTTLRSVIADYLAARDGKLRPRSMVEVTRYLGDPRYFGRLHGMPIDRIERRDVAQEVLRIEREIGLGAAIGARSALSACIIWAMRTGVADKNPLVGAYVPEGARSRDRVLRDSELAAVWRACADDSFGRIVRLLILTGCRRTEVGGMAWDELDRERGLWTIPAARAKNRRPHALPLPPAAWAIIDAVHRRTDRDLLFGERANSGYRGWHLAKRRLDARLGDSVKPWGLHDVRRTVATGMADIGVQPHVIEAALNHVSGHKAGVAGLYNRSVYSVEMRAALALWADHLRALVDGGERTVVSFPQSA